MVRICKLSDISEDKIVKDIISGKIFIYPTDTIYGLGCNALLDSSVRKIREIKQREDKPFSVIAHSKKWILENFEVEEEYLNKLPGPFTLILKAKKQNLVSKEINKGLDTLGVRIPNHSFVKFVQKANVPFVTTSVNITGEKFITCVEEIPKSIFDKVDIIVDDGKLNNKPSNIIDLTQKNPSYINR